MAEPLTRIFSDLHFGDCTSTVRSLDALRPLLDGADRIILNGDIIDTIVLDDPKEAVGAVRSFFASVSPDVTWISGNHDPDVSELHELTLANGRMWITHGDVLFDDIVPWSAQRDGIVALVRELRAQPGADFDSVEGRLELIRRTCERMPPSFDPAQKGPLWRALRILRALFPPKRLFAMVKVWLATPHVAAAFAEAHRPSAQFVVLGHTHLSGAWARRGRIVLNTGSFCSPSQPAVVELHGDRVRTRPILSSRGQFYLGPVSAEFPLSDPTPSAQDVSS